MSEYFFIIRKGSPAIKLVQRELSKGKLQPGSVVLATDEEMESWTKDVHTIALPDKP